MEDDFLKLLREQERILGEMRSSVHRWMDELLRNAFDPESFLSMAASMGFDLSQISGAANPQAMPDPYRVLDLEKTATDEQVKKRYRELLRKLHPDTAGVDGTAYMFQALVFAYQQIAKERGWK